MFNSWKNIGPSLVSEDAYRAMEVLRECHIPCSMPSDDMFFADPCHLPHPALRWNIRVRRRDVKRARAALAREGLVNPEVLSDGDVTRAARALSDRRSRTRRELSQNSGSHHRGAVAAAFKAATVASDARRYPVHDS